MEKQVVEKSVAETMERALAFVRNFLPDDPIGDRARRRVDEALAQYRRAIHE